MVMEPLFNVNFCLFRIGEYSVIVVGSKYKQELKKVFFHTICKGTYFC